MASVVFHNDTCLDARSQKKRNIVTGSVAANEARAIYEPLNKIRRMHALLKAAGFTFDEPPGILSDNAATLISLTGGKMTPQCRTLKPKILAARQFYAQGKLRLGYVESEYNHADLLSKPNHSAKQFMYHYHPIQQAQPDLTRIKWLVTDADLAWLQNPPYKKRGVSRHTKED